MIAYGEAIAEVAALLGDQLVVTANGYVARELYGARDRPENFYMLGSMGLAPPIALGLALTRPERRVVVFDGDGNLLMGLGHLAMVGERQPANFCHLVFDNGSYASTGGQRAISDRVGLEKMAAAAGYRHVARVDRAAELRAAALAALTAEGPAFLAIGVAPGHPPGSGRVGPEPLEIAARVRRSASGEAP